MFQVHAIARELDSGPRTSYSSLNFNSGPLKISNIIKIRSDNELNKILVENNISIQALVNII